MQLHSSSLALLAGLLRLYNVVHGIAQRTPFDNTSIPAAPEISGQIVVEMEYEIEVIEPLTNECPCTTSNIWLDVFFLIDSSLAMTSAGFDYAMAFVESALFRMTIGQAMGQQTRVGFITYGENAELQYNLSHWQSTADLLNKLDIRFHSTLGTNIEGAIRLAVANFVPPHHRPNARKVIVIIASAFEAGRYNDPSVEAATFKEDGGIIITVEYVQVHGAPVNMLDTLATPGYALSNRYGKIDVKQLHQLFCKANCFCPIYYKAFSLIDDIPSGGCFRKSLLPAIQPLAQRSCHLQFNGTIASVDSKEKSNFLLSMMRPKSTFWIGLTYKNDVYQWSDRNHQIDGETFNQWAPGYPDSQQGDCVRMEGTETNDGIWYNVPCGKDLLYICQIVSCSTDHYCDVI